MSNLEKHTAQVPMTLPRTLATCTDKKATFLMLAKTEQTLSIQQTLASSDLMMNEKDKVMMIGQIVRALEFFLKVTGKEMEVFKIQRLAGDLYEKFKCETYEDVVLMLKKARMGDFGKVYKFDSFTLMNWANQYLNHKAEEREKQYQSQKNAYQKSEEKAGKFFNELPPEIQEKFNKKFSKSEPRNRNMKEFLTNEKHRDSIKKKMASGD